MDNNKSNCFIMMLLTVAQEGALVLEFYFEYKSPVNFICG